jgi:Flp pilus assembly protein TadD
MFRPFATRVAPSLAAAALLTVSACLAVSACGASPRAALDRAQKLHDSGREDEALKVVDAILAADPGDADARLLRSRIQAQSGHEEEALAALRQLAAAEPRRRGVHRAMAEILARGGHSPQAVNQFEKELALVPDDRDTLTDLGLFYLQTGQIDQAADRLRRATAGGGGNARAHRAMAEVLVKQQRYEDALAEQRAAVAMAPDDADLLVTHARALYAYGHAEEARKVLSDAQKRGVEDGALYAEQARQAREALDYPGAVAAYQKAVALDGRRAEFHLELGKTYLLMGRDSEARAAFEEARDLDAGNAYAPFYLASILADEGKTEDAAKELRRSLDLDPLNPKAHYALAQALQRLGQQDEARKEFAIHAKILEKLRAAHASGTATLD